MKQYKNILACTAFSEDANKAVRYALDLAKENEARLYILHVPHSPYAYLRHVVDEHAPEGVRRPAVHPVGAGNLPGPGTGHGGAHHAPDPVIAPAGHVNDGVLVSHQNSVYLLPYVIRGTGAHYFCDFAVALQ